MKIHHVAQGSPEWLALRATHNCASDAPVMMGTSDKLTRSDLVRMKATGDEREFSAWVQENLLARGHEVEAFARAEIERELGEELYPATISDDEGYLLASLDGVNMAGDTALEVKLWNEKLVAAMRVGEVPPLHFWQLEQQILVAKLERVIFVCTDGTRDRFLKVEYRAVDGRVKQLLAGWRQFDEDVKNYQHVEVIPKAVASPGAITTLPALVASVDATGIKIRDNLDAFGAALNGYIAGVNREPKTDQDFADADEAVKTMERAEGALKAAREAVLAQTGDVDTLLRKAADFQEIARQTRLSLSKLIETKKQEIRSEILQEGQRAFAAHHEKLNARFGRRFMPTIPTDFPGAMRQKKTVASLRDAVATELARAKIAANEVADQIGTNLKALGAEAQGFEHLFADLDRLVVKAPEDFVVLVRARITEHKAAEEKRLEAERARIREEEAVKLRAEEDARQRALAQAEAVRQQQSAPNVHDDASARLKRDLDRECKPAMPAAKSRPSDDEIIAALALHYHVHESAVIAWLLDMDLEAASARMAKEFQPVGASRAA